MTHFFLNSDKKLIFFLIFTYLTFSESPAPLPTLMNQASVACLWREGGATCLMFLLAGIWFTMTEFLTHEINTIPLKEILYLWAYFMNVVRMSRDAKRVELQIWLLTTSWILFTRRQNLGKKYKLNRIAYLKYQNRKKQLNLIVFFFRSSLLSMAPRAVELSPGRHCRALLQCPWLSSLAPNQPIVEHCSDYPCWALRQGPLSPAATGTVKRCSSALGYRAFLQPRNRKALL